MESMFKDIDISELEEVTVEQERPRFQRKQTHPHRPTAHDPKRVTAADKKRLRRRWRNIRNARRGGFGKLV